MRVMNRALGLGVFLAALFAACYFGAKLEDKIASAHQNVTQTGPMNGVSFNFDSTGAPMGPIYCTSFRGTVTTSGTFSFTGTGPLLNGSPAWTNPSGAWIEQGGMMSAGTAVGSNYIPFPTTFTIASNAITLSGVAKSPTTLVVLGATAVASTVAEPITMKVCAN